MEGGFCRKTRNKPGSHETGEEIFQAAETEFEMEAFEKYTGNWVEFYVVSA